MTEANVNGKRAALYLRISTDQGKQDADNQRLQLRQFCRAQECPIVIEYEDHETGSKSDRAGFRQMIHDASLRKWDLLVFWSLTDSLGRARWQPSNTWSNWKATGSAGGVSPSRLSTAPGPPAMS